MTAPEEPAPAGTDNPQPSTSPWTRTRILTIGAFAATLLAVGAAVAIVKAGGEEPRADSPARPSAWDQEQVRRQLGLDATPTTDAPPVVPSTSAPPAAAGNTVEFSCYLDSDFEDSVTFTATVDSKGVHDFSEGWQQKPRSCEIASVNDTDVTRFVQPLNPVEEAAYKASGFDDGDISVLYTICADVDPDDTYVKAGFAMSPEQIAEMSGALKLCPTHPYAKKWRAAMKRGQGDAKMEADGRLFYDGTYRVGKDVKAGTYVAKNVDGCYWERQDRNGEIIDNNFVNAAKRVQVTIRKSDYGFHAEGCGEWRPV